MNSRGALHATGGERTPLLAPERVARESTRVDLRRLGAIGLVLFCLATAVGLVRVIAVSNEVLTALQQLQAPRTGAAVPTPTPTASGAIGGAGDAAPRPTNDSTRVVVVFSDGPHLAQLALAVEQGVRSTGAELRVRSVANASFATDVRWADAVVLGSHVVNANVEPAVRRFHSH